tara:strand:+ start:4915 stop:6264 length:1350 start_codon:yes stop_codon:yes gene_type:complete
MATVLQRTGSGAYYGKLTMSFWIKRAVLGEQGLFGRREGSATANLSTCHFSGVDQLLINFRDGGGTSKYYMITNRAFKDINSWYHIHLMLDGDNATQSDRSKLYINGVRETSFALLNNPSSTGYEVNLFVGGSYNTYIARGLRSQIDTWLTYDGCMSNFNCSTGYVYEPTVFGEVDTTTGQWKIINDPTFTPGTDGFTILKDGDTITDQSAGSNDFTVYSGTLTASKDCPSNTFAVLNPSIKHESYLTYTNANTTQNISNNDWNSSFSTIGMTTGKYYFETYWSSGTYYQPGIRSVQQATGITNGTNDWMGNDSQGYSYDCYGGSLKNNGGDIAGQTGLTTTAVGNYVGVFVDMDNNKIYFSKNGVMVNTTGADITSGLTYMAGVSSWGANPSVIQCNFGNGVFGTTTLTGTTYSGSDGNGIFKYDPNNITLDGVSKSFKSLSTKGLNA